MVAKEGFCLAAPALFLLHKPYGESGKVLLEFPLQNQINVGFLRTSLHVMEFHVGAQRAIVL